MRTQNLVAPLLLNHVRLYILTLRINIFYEIAHCVAENAYFLILKKDLLEPSQPIVFRRASDVTSLNVIIISHEGDSALITSELINIYQENGLKTHFYCFFSVKQLRTIFRSNDVILQSPQ